MCWAVLLSIWVVTGGKRCPWTECISTLYWDITNAAEWPLATLTIDTLVWGILWSATTAELTYVLKGRMPGSSFQFLSIEHQAQKRTHPSISSCPWSMEPEINKRSPPKQWHQNAHTPPSYPRAVPLIFISMLTRYTCPSVCSEEVLSCSGPGEL